MLHRMGINKHIASEMGRNERLRDNMGMGQGM